MNSLSAALRIRARVWAVFSGLGPRVRGPGRSRVSSSSDRSAGGLASGRSSVVSWRRVRPRRWWCPLSWCAVVGVLGLGLGLGLMRLSSDPGSATARDVSSGGPRRDAILSTHLSIGDLGAIVPTLVSGWLADLPDGKGGTVPAVAQVTKTGYV